MEPSAPERVHRQWPFWLLLATLAVIGLYLRWANLENVQPFDGDQGRDYIEVYRWLMLGHWPLLGPGRVVGDFNIGPGWYYALAPALFLSGMSICAGAATIGFFAVVGAVLSAVAVRRLSGSALAGLVAAALWCLGPKWIALDRFLWNPHLMPFATTAFLTILAFCDKHPLRCLVAYVLLAAIVPQIHTTGYLPLAASLLPMAFSVWMRRADIRGAATWKLLVAAAVLAVWLGLLYLPPLWHELTGDFHNLVPYVKHTFQAAPPFEAPAAERLGYAGGTLSTAAFVQCFGKCAQPLAWRVCLVILLAAGLGIVALRAPCPARGPVVSYVLLLILIYVHLLFKRGAWVGSYYIVPILPVAGIVFPWAAGTLLQARTIPWRAAGGIALALLVGCRLWTLPEAFAIKDGAVWYGTNLAYNRNIAKRVIADAAGQPFSLILLEDGNFNAHFHWLLIDLGKRPENWETYNGTTLRRNHFGKVCFVIVRGKLRNLPVQVGRLAIPLPTSDSDPQITVYKVPLEAIPNDLNWLEVYPKDGKLLFDCVY